MRHNFSRNSDYHTQRNNVHVPFAACNRTSMVMGFKQAGYPFPKSVGDRQEEDAAYEDVFDTDDARAYQAKVAAWSVGAYPPDQVHAVLEWGFNNWLAAGEPADTFRTNVRADEMVSTLLAGGGVVLSGNFPLPSGSIGHIVSLAGYVGYDGEKDQVIRWIVDDPYGNWHTDYKDHHGNDVDFSTGEFTDIFDRKRNQQYWAHLIKKYEA